MFLATVVAQLTSGERSAMFARFRRLASVQLSPPSPRTPSCRLPVFQGKAEAFFVRVAFCDAHIFVV